MAAERPSRESESARRGDALEPRVREPIERTLGADLTGVRVHTDTFSGAMVDSAGARALTFGPDIFVSPRESPSNLELMAHEAAHVLQQRGAPRVQLSGGGAGDRFEREAESVSAAVLEGRPAAVVERADSVRPQFSLWSRITGAIAELGAGVRDRVLSYIREHARSIPGYDLLAVILGRDPISSQPVERNAVNIVRGVLGLVPGGAALFEKLQQTRVIERASEWFREEIAKLNLTWDYISGLFRRAWDSLSAADLLNPGGAFERIRAIFAAPVSRLVNFAAAAGNKLLEFIIEGALQIAGDAGGRVMALLRRAGAVVRTIINDPIAFGRNLIAAVRGGFDRFRSNVLEHLRNGLIGWLTGAMTGAGLTLPRSFTDWRGIIQMVLGILGLTYQLFRRLLVRALGEERVRYLEGVFDFLRVLITQGLGAAWERIREYVGNLTDMVIGGIRDWVARTVVGQAIVRLISMLNPVGAIIQTAIAIYNTVMFFVERIQQIAALANSVFDSIANIAAGNISGAIAYVERAMANALPVIISFLARLIGLGGISERIREIIRRIQATIERALERVVDWIVARVRTLISAIRGPSSAGATGTAAAAAGPAAVKAEALRLFRSRVQGGRMASTSQLSTVVQGIIAELRPRGLRSFSVRITDVEREQFRVDAAASEPDSLFIRWNEVFAAEDLGSAQMQELREQFSTAGMETFAAVSVDGGLIGSVTNTSQGHAEEQLLRPGGRWDQALTRAESYLAADQTYTVEIAVIINRAPCGAICTPALTRAVIAAKRRLGRDSNRVRFVLAASGDYQPAESGSATPAQVRAQLAEFARARGISYLEAIERNVAMIVQQAPNIRDLQPTSRAGLTLLEAAGWNVRVLATRRARESASGDLLVPRSLRDLADAVRAVKAQFAADFNTRMTSR